MEFAISYYGCQKCTERVNCDRCKEELEEKVLRDPDIRHVDIPMGPKRMVLDSPLESDVLEELLEEYGIFVQ